MKNTGISMAGKIVITVLLWSIQILLIGKMVGLM